MTVARGIRSMKESKNKNTRRNSDGTWNLRVDDGEEVLVRFIGLFRPARSEKVVRATPKADLAVMAEIYGAHRRENDGKREPTLDAVLRRMTEEEPIQAAQHWAKSSTFYCADVGGPYEGVAGCVCCHARGNDRKSKQFSYPRDVFGFSVWDYRTYHKIAHGDDAKAEYVKCTADEGRCKNCNKASEKGPVYPAKMNGLRKWVVGRKWATSIVSMNDSLQKKCKSCGKGKIKVAGYMCGNPACGDVMPDIDALDSMVRCGACNSKTYPVEEITCTNCDNPVRGSLSDVDVLVTRAGSSKDDTTYNFQPQGFDTFLYAEQARCVDWATEVKPPSTAEQAATLGLSRDPFGGKGVGATSYDDDDDDEPVRKPKKKQPVDDEDDD